MATTYKWTIQQMDAYIKAEGEENVIYTVHYTYTGTKELEGVIYSGAFISTENYEYKQGDPFISYENTEAFEAVVIGWLEQSLDVQAIQESIELNIQSQITPLTEELFFTWQ